MPGRDSRGPEGQGPLTGRGRGYCGDADRRTDAFPRGRGTGYVRGRRFGRGGGPGRAWGYRRAVDDDVDAPTTSEQLAAEVTRLREEVATLSRRLADQETGD